MYVYIFYKNICKYCISTGELFLTFLIFYSSYSQFFISFSSLFLHFKEQIRRKRNVLGEVKG